MKLRRIIFLSILLGGLAVGGVYVYQYYQDKKLAAAAVDSKSPDKLYTVKRGDLTVGVMLTGSINTKVKHKLALEMPVQTKLIAIVDENTRVSKGDIIARFETEDLQTKIDDAKIELANKEKDLLIYREERTILLSTNEADIRSANDNVSNALDSYNKYRKLEGPRDKDAQELKVNNAYKSLVESKEKYMDAYNALYKPDNPITDEEKRKTLKKTMDSELKNKKASEVSYNSAILDRKIFKRYTYPNQLKSIKDKLDQAKLELNKVKVRTASNLSQKDNQIYYAENNIRRIERDLESKLYQMGGMQLIAPANGIVTYGDPDRRWGNIEIKIGMDVRTREVLVTIPDMSQMIVDINIPEQYRSKVRVGNELIITPDSIPNLKIHGSIGSIASLPVLLIPWDSGSPKIYRAQVEFKSDDPRIVSGMSVQVEVVSQILKDVLSVPIEAVQEENGKFFVYRETLTKPEPVPVTLGVANNSFVEIKSGLEEGNEIYLYRPFQTSRTD